MAHAAAKLGSEPLGIQHYPFLRELCAPHFDKPNNPVVAKTKYLALLGERIHPELKVGD
jgi:hypothetical protein